MSSGKYYRLKVGEYWHTAPRYMVVSGRLCYGEFNTERQAREFIEVSKWIGGTPEIKKKRNGGRVKIGKP